jgi:hypothetical protein
VPAGAYPYLADGPTGVRVIDISDPRQPRVVGAFDSGLESVTELNRSADARRVYAGSSGFQDAQGNVEGRPGSAVVLSGDDVPLRIKATDAYLQEIAPGSRSGKRWQMGEQVIYVIEGEGHDLHWDVEVEIADRYYAHVEQEPTRWNWQAGNVIWVPQNTVFQHFNSHPDKPVKLLVGSNRLLKKLGYQRVVDFEYAPECAVQHGVWVHTPESSMLVALVST